MIFIKIIEVDQGFVFPQAKRMTTCQVRQNNGATRTQINVYSLKIFTLLIFQEIMEYFQKLVISREYIMMIDIEFHNSSLMNGGSRTHCSC